MLPPVSKLSKEEAEYHFLSGYTAKVAGTELGVTEPTVTFSECFGAAFLTRDPIVYAKLLGDKIEKYGTKVYLVNTGWTGGSVGTGKRISISSTRACIDSILDGSIESSPTVLHPVFDLEFPTFIKGVSLNVSNPIESWEDKSNYIETCQKLQNLFDENYKKL